LAAPLLHLFFSQVASLFALIGIYAFLLFFAVEASVVLIIISLALAIVGVIKGIGAIKVFSQRAAEGCKKPVITLVFGIIGLSESALSILIAAIYFFFEIIIFVL